MHLVDDDGPTFHHLLQFLYTGMVPSIADREELFLLADKYARSGESNILIALCHSAVSPGKYDEGSELICFKLYTCMNLFRIFLNKD